ncbi:MAG: energy transducer TonB [Lishizhenia sp.]
MNKAILFFLLTSTAFCYSQQRDCEYSPTEFYTGKCESVFPNGKLRSVTNFVNGLRHGEFHQYYESGKIASYVNFYDDKYVGKSYRFSKDSVVTFILYLDSTETGNFQKYNRNGSQLIATGKFKNGFRDGTWYSYSLNGKKIDSILHSAEKTNADFNESHKRGIPILPYEETVDNLFFEVYGIDEEITLKLETIIDEPDVYAQYPGGAKNMKTFIKENIKYPKRALNEDIEDKVYLSFIVELDGSLTDISVLKGVSDELNIESKRVIKTMPKWKPAIYKGKEVRSKVIMPISFILSQSK